MKYTKFIPTMMLALIVSSVSVSAQQGGKFKSNQERQGQRPVCDNLDEGQKDALKVLRETSGEALKQWKFKISEAEAHQQTLMGKSNPDEKTIMKGVEDIVKMKGEAAKDALAMRIEVSKITKQDLSSLKQNHRSGAHHKQFANKPGKNHPNAKMMGQENGHHRRPNAARVENNGRQHGKRMNDNHKHPQNLMGQKNGRDGRPNLGLAENRYGMRMNANQKHPRNMKQGGAFLTDDQKITRNELISNNAQKITDLKNKLNELKVHQQTILGQKEVDLKDAYKNIDAMTKLKTELAVIHVESRLKMQALLSDEQKAKMGQRQMHKRENARGNGLRG